MSWDEIPGVGDDRAPICPSCGVTALPMEGGQLEARFVCENPDCESFGDEV